MESKSVKVLNNNDGIINLAYDDSGIQGNSSSYLKQSITFPNGEHCDGTSAEEGKHAYRSLLPFIIVFGFGSLCSQSISVYLSSQITVIEKAFGMSSAKSGILLGANDFGFVVTVLLASHFLKNYKIPRILAICILTFGISGLLTSLPHFITHKKESSAYNFHNNSAANGNDRELCISVRNSNHTDTKKCSHTSHSSSTESDSDNNEWIIVYIALLMVIQGVAKAPRAPLSSLYIDNNSTKEKIGFYFGILMSFTIFGPIIATVAGGFFNKIPVDLTESSISPKDPRWIGAWWLGFVIFGACSIIWALPIFCFPNSLKIKGQPKYSTNINITTIDQKDSFKEILKDLPKSVIRVTRQPVYSCNVLSILFVMFGFMALSSFGPKYIENQFHIPTWKANILLGLEKMFTTVAGTFFGGLITRRFKLSMHGCVKMIFISRLIAFICQCFNFIIGCDNPSFVGLNRPANESETTTQIVQSESFSQAMNMSCDCSSVSYLPVCADGLTYFSPCHAGCRMEEHTGYANCSATASGHATPGICDTGCNYLIPFLVLNAFSSLFGTLTIAPSYITMLRSVLEEDRAMAIGIQSFLMSLLVFLPAPIVYGIFLDSICLAWKTTCSGKGSCALYDITAMRYQLISISVSLIAAGVVCSCFTVFFSIRKSAADERHKKAALTNIPPSPLVRTS